MWKPTPTVRLACFLLTSLAACQGYISPQDQGTGDATTGHGGSPSLGKTDAHADVAKGVTDSAASNFAPLAAAAQVSKVKTLLTGLPATPAEIAAVTADPTAMKGLVGQWITTPQYQQKMLEFFEVAFQQNQSVMDDFFGQDSDYGAEFAASDGTFNNLMLQNHHEMFARTALELIAEGRPFTETFTTTRFMLTPALAATMALLDSQHYNDSGNLDVDENFQRDPTIHFSFTSNGPVPSSATMDPTGSSFMTFFSSSVSGGASNPCVRSGVTYTPHPQYKTAFEDEFQRMTFGLGFRPSEQSVGQDPFVDGGVGFADGGNLPPGACDSLIDTTTLSVADFSHWRMVNIRRPAAGEAPTPFWDVDDLRSGTELVFNIPRVGFYTTPTFLATWATNPSNQARVTMNQMMIVALNQAFDGTDPTVPLSTAAVDESHLAPGCIDCHRQLDPMRQFFRHDYTISFHEQIDAGGLYEPDAGAGSPSYMPQFAWGGVAQQGTSIADLGRLMAQQPNVASGWTQKLCEWGTSAPCVTTDPEFQRIVNVFQTSNFDWTSLVTELFSSPIMTYASPTVTSEQEGQTVPIARQGHLCALLSDRLGITDICGLNPATSVPGSLRSGVLIAGAYPSDQFSRGQVSPSVFVLANDPNLFTRSGLENFCIAISNVVVDVPEGKFSSLQPTVAVNDIVTNLMGLTGARAAPMVQLLNEHYQEALATPKSDAGTINPTDALRSTFTLACLSPYVIGIGQ